MREFSGGTPSIERDLERVQARILDVIEGGGPTPDDGLGPVREAIAELARAKGKLLRPRFILIGASFGAADRERVISLAASIELLHIATLVHDDIIDEASFRRGVPALHVRFPTKVAVLAGDWLLSKAFSLAAESTSPENAQGLSRLIAAICASEIAQDLAKGHFDLGVREYLRIIAGKTATLFSLALYAGATEAGVKASEADLLRRIGYCFGMAFQITDDMLDLRSTQDEARKPVGSDLREGLCTLPMIFALEKGGAELRAAFARAVGDPDVSRALAERVSELGGLERAGHFAALYLRRAERALAGLSEGPGKEGLRMALTRLPGRKS